MSRLKEVLKSAYKPILVVFAGILFYELLEHFSAVRGALSLLRRVLRPILFGIGIAYVVNIPATLFQKHVFGRLKAKKPAWMLSVLLAYVITFGLVAAIVLLVVPKAAEGVGMLLSNIENYYNSVVKWATNFWQNLKLSESFTEKAVELSEALAARVQNFAMEAIPKLLNYTFSTVGFIANAFLAVTFSVYAVYSKNKLMAHMRRLVRVIFNEKNSERALEFAAYSNATFRGYISGQLIGSLLLGVFCYIGMLIFKMPYPEMISVVTAAFALIPIIGPWISTIACAIIILVAAPGNPMLAFWFVVMILVIQQFESGVIGPRIVGRIVGLSSLWVLIGIIVGGGLFGITGLLFAVPVTAVLYRLAADWTNERAKLRGVPIVSTIPENDYDKKRKKYASQPVRRPFFDWLGEKYGKLHNNETPSEQAEREEKAQAVKKEAAADNSGSTPGKTGGNFRPE